MCWTTGGIYSGCCTKQHEGKTCLLMLLWDSTHLWQQFQRGSCWCCAGLCRYRCRHRHHWAGRWWSTALLLDTPMIDRLFKMHVFRLKPKNWEHKSHSNYISVISWIYVDANIYPSRPCCDHEVESCALPCRCLSALLEMDRPSSLDQ